MGKKITDILNEDSNNFKSQFDYLCENYGRQFAIDYFANKLNEADDEQQQNNQGQNQDQQQVSNEELEKTKQGMINNFSKVKELVSTFMKLYSGVCDDQLNTLVTQIGEVDKTIGGLDLSVFTELTKQRMQQDQQKSQQQQPQQNGNQQQNQGQQQAQQPQPNQQNQQQETENEDPNKPILLERLFKKALNENLMDIEYGGKDNNIFQNMKFNWQYIDKLQKDETELIQFAFGKLVNNMTVVKIIPTDELYNAYSKIHNKSTNDVDAEKEFNNVNSMILLGFNNATNEPRSTFYVSELDGDWGKVKNAAEDCQKFLKRCVFEVNTQINKKQEHILCNFNFKIFKNDIGKYASILRQAETIVKNSPYILYSQIIGDLSENDFGRCICNIFVNNGKLFGLQTDNKTKIEFNVNNDKAGFFSRL